MDHIKTKWRCGECGDIHSIEDYARMCCLPSVKQVFMCPVCDDDHESEGDAIECCPDPDTEPRQMSARDLEAQGQQRLSGL